MIVDAHVHLLPDRLAAAIRGFFQKHMPDAMLYPYRVAEARAAIAAAGVTRCWSLPYAHKPRMASALNRWMAETFADDALVEPGATVHPGDDVPAVVSEAIDDLGLRLFKLHCSVGKFGPDDPRLDTLWQRVAVTGHPVVVHAGHAIDGTTSAAEVAPIARVARRWPDARIIVAHCGAPAVHATLALLRETRSVYADLTPVLDAPAPVVPRAFHGFERRLLFGSDAPNTGVRIEDAIAHVRALGFARGDEDAVLGGTATALLAR